MALSPFFDPSAARRGNGVPPRFQFNGVNSKGGAPGSWSYAISVQSPETRQYAWRYTPIPYGTLVAFDFGVLEHGPMNFNTFDDRFMVPYSQPIPQLPPPDQLKGQVKDYKMTIRLSVMLPQFGLAQWTIGSVIVQNVLYNVYNEFEHAREAAEGKIPVYRLRPSRQVPIASRNNEMHPAPVFEPEAWVIRNVERFGPRTVPAPLPILEQARANPALDAPAAPSEPPAANDNVGGITAANANGDEPPFDSGAASDDPFAGMTPTKKPRAPF